MSISLLALKEQLPSLPELPSPFSVIPEKVQSTVVVKILNQLLATAIKEGDLDFLHGSSVSVGVTDLKIKFALGFDGKALIVRQWQEQDSLNLAGNVHDFLLLATRTEDSDTLFFQRRLKMSGDTELGLEVKNLLDGMDTDSVKFHQEIDVLLNKVLYIYERTH